MKVGYIVEHIDSDERERLGRGRVVFWRKGQRSALVKWDGGSCQEHYVGALRQVNVK